MLSNRLFFIQSHLVIKCIQYLKLRKSITVLLLKWIWNDLTCKNGILQLSIQPHKIRAHPFWMQMGEFSSFYMVYFAFIFLSFFTPHRGEWEKQHQLSASEAINSTEGSQRSARCWRGDMGVIYLLPGTHIKPKASFECQVRNWYAGYTLMCKNNPPSWFKIFTFR